MEDQNEPGVNNTTFPRQDNAELEGTATETMTLPNWPPFGSLEFPMFDFDPSGTRMQEFNFFIAPPDMNDLGQGDLLW